MTPEFTNTIIAAAICLYCIIELRSIRKAIEQQEAADEKAKLN